MRRPLDNLAGAVLAGGRARRYGGAAKGTLRLADGRTILERLLDELARAAIDEVIVCANDPRPYAALGRAIVPDVHGGAGPLGGIEAALSHYAGRTAGTVVLPCDLPGISASEIRALVEAFRRLDVPVVVAETGDCLWHPLCCVVDNGLRGPIAAALERGERAVGRLWRTLGAAAVRFEDDRPFFNVNCPEDLARWQEGAT